MTRLEIENAITPEYLMTSRVIFLSMAAAPVFIFSFILYMEFFLTGTGRPEDLRLYTMLTYVHLGYTLITIAAGSWIYQKMFLERTTFATAEAYLEQLRKSLIIRTALYEGAAFFGLVVIVISSMHGALSVMPSLWINLISTVLLMMHAFSNIPSTKKIIETYMNLFG